jgi:hypothetical protein
MDPNISKATTGKERVVAECAESQSTSRAPNRTRFLAVQSAIRDKMQCDKKSLLTAEIEKMEPDDVSRTWRQYY